MFLIGRRLIKNSDLVSTLLFYFFPFFLLPSVFILWEIFIAGTFIPENFYLCAVISFPVGYSLVRYIILLIYFNSSQENRSALVHSVSKSGLSFFILFYDLFISLILTWVICLYRFKEDHSHYEYYIVLTVTNFISSSVTWVFLMVYCPFYALPKLVMNLQKEEGQKKAN